MAFTPRAQGEVNRIIARFTIEKEAAGWTTNALCREVGVSRSVVDRWETGTTQHPTVNHLAALAEPLDLRLDLVAPRHLPFLGLDEFEVRALIAGALAGWQAQECGHPQEQYLLSALSKLGKINQGVPRVTA